MVSGLFLGSVLRGGRGSASCWWRRLCSSRMERPRAHFNWSQCRALAHLTRGKMSFMHRHEFNIKHVTMPMQFEHCFFWLSWWGCFLIFYLKQNCWRGRDRKKHTSVRHPHSLLSIKKSLDNNHPSFNRNLLSLILKKNNNPVTRKKKEKKKPTSDCWKMV